MADFPVIDGDSWRKSLTNARKHRKLRAAVNKELIKTAMNEYLNKQTLLKIREFRQEANKLHAAALLLENAYCELNDGHLFLPFDSDTPEVLFIGDTVYTKYGESLVVESINREEKLIKFVGGKELGDHRICGIEKRVILKENQ